MAWLRGPQGSHRATSRNLGPVLFVAVALAPTPLRAEPAPETAPPGRTRRALAPEDDGDPTRIVPRVLFALPRLAFEAASLPLVGLAALEDEYELVDRVEELFYDETHTVGIFPTAFVETGQAPSVGMRLLHHDLLGDRERLRLRAGYGGEERQVYEADLRSGRTDDRTSLAFSVGHRLEDRERFYGIGNADESPAVLGRAPHDPFDAAVETRYGLRETWASAAGTVRALPELSFTLSERWREREIDPRGSEPDEPSLAELYDTSGLAAIGTNRTDVFLELEAEVDTRVSARADVPRDEPSSGWLVRGALGRQSGPGLLRSDFGRVRLDMQRYLDLYRGDRVLRLRLHAVWIVGKHERIPFPDLATLGGGELLRGYARGRFHDRVSALGSAEYRYPVSESITAYLFTDAGRVYDDLDTLAPDGLRVGFGGGMRVYTTTSTLLRLQLASSIEGGLFLRLEIHPDDDA